MAHEFVIAGHSHTFALGVEQGYQGPLGLQPAPGWGEGGYFLMDIWRSDGARSADYWDELARIAPGRNIVLSYYGNQHHSEFMFSSGRPFDFVMNEVESSVVANSKLIPKRMVEDFLNSTLDGLRLLITRLRQAGARGIFILGSPGQRPDIKRYAQKLLETDFARNFAAVNGFDIAQMAVTNPSVLLKIWLTLQETLERLSNDLGATFVSAPPESIDDGGYLRAEYHNGDDLSHANLLYGQLMIRRTVDAILQGQAA